MNAAYPFGRAISLRHSSAVTTAKGRLSVRFRKCLFSETRASAPTHSAYAAINASADFNPRVSYLKPVSKGTTKSSSIDVRLVAKLMKSLYSSDDRFRRTSSETSLGRRREWAGKLSTIISSSSLDDGAFRKPKEKMYSLESRTSSKFLIPELFAGFPELLYYLFFGHPLKGVLSLSHKLSQVFKVLFGFFGIRFHVLNIAQTAELCKRSFNSEVNALQLGYV